jgi:hypothetical protein
MRSSTLRLGLALGVVLLVGAALRAPHASRGLPFFYLEDEAHHFQRTVQMVKDGSFDPEYFNKPSFHFYLRMPVVAASFISAAKAGEIRRVSELVTRSQVPGGGWAYVASHERIALWNRVFGVGLGLASLVLVFAITRTLTGRDHLATGAALLAAVSPALSADAAKVGVDTPLVLMCLLAIWLALRLQAQVTTGRLVAAGLVAGLAVSTKYNAAPIAILPLVACLAAREYSASRLVLAAATPVVGFLLGTPYALITLPAFLNGIAFEAWHYGTLGHGYATGEPGLPQAWHYVRWFASADAIGVLAVLLGTAGALVLAARRDPRAVTVLAFPVLFFVLMAMQKVNFTRNMLVMLPVFAILAAVAAGAAAGRLRWLGVFALGIACVQPAVEAVRAVRGIAPDSRRVAGEWLARAAGPRSLTAVAWSLAWPPVGPAARGVTPIDPQRIDPGTLYMQGFDRVVTDGSFEPGQQQSPMRLEHVVPGSRATGIPISPEVRIYRLDAPFEVNRAAFLATPLAQVALPIRYGDRPPSRVGDASRCWADKEADGGAQGVGGDCWLPGRISRIALDRAALAPAGSVSLEAELYAPWPNQQCTLEAGTWRSADLCAGTSAAEWRRIQADVPAADLKAAGGVIVSVDVVSPLQARPATPPIRTGLAVRGVALR